MSHDLFFAKAGHFINTFMLHMMGSPLGRHNPDFSWHSFQWQVGGTAVLSIWYWVGFWNYFNQAMVTVTSEPCWERLRSSILLYGGLVQRLSVPAPTQHWLLWGHHCGSSGQCVEGEHRQRPWAFREICGQLLEPQLSAGPLARATVWWTCSENGRQSFPPIPGPQ